MGGTYREFTSFGDREGKKPPAPEKSDQLRLGDALADESESERLGDALRGLLEEDLDSVEEVRRIRRDE